MAVAIFFQTNPISLAPDVVMAVFDVACLVTAFPTEQCLVLP